MADDSPLAGLDGPSQELFRRLAARESTDVADVAGAALSRLLAAGLVVEDDGQVQAVPPRAVLEARAEEHARDARLAQEAADLFHDIWLTERMTDSRVEISSGEVAEAQTRRLLEQADDEIIGMSIGPKNDRPIQPMAGLLAALQRGVTVRAVYDSRILSNPLGLAAATECMVAGEDARVFPNVPVSLVLSRAHAILTLPYGSGEQMQQVSIQHGRMIAAMRAIFESYWERSMPLTTETLAPGAPPDAQRLLMLLSIGLTDRAIARELGVSERTIGRRVTRLQQVLGAETRFQLGIQATRHHWL